MSKKNKKNNEKSMPEKGSFAINFASHDQDELLCIHTPTPTSLPKRIALLRKASEEHGIQMRVTIAQPYDCKVAKHNAEFFETSRAQVKAVYSRAFQIFVTTETLEDMKFLMGVNMTGEIPPSKETTRFEEQEKEPIFQTSNRKLSRNDYISKRGQDFYPDFEGVPSIFEFMNDGASPENSTVFARYLTPDSSFLLLALDAITGIAFGLTFEGEGTAQPKLQFGFVDMESLVSDSEVIRWINEDGTFMSPVSLDDFFKMS